MKRYKNLTPDEVLAQAIRIEEINSMKYSLWADRFRPYNKEVSELLDELSEEEKLYKLRLLDIYNKRCKEPIRRVDSSRISREFKEDDLEDDHFFVVDESMGKKLLLRALKTEFDSFVFYKKAKMSTEDPSLLKVYELLADFEEEHVEQLRQNLEEELEDSGS